MKVVLVGMTQLVVTPDAEITLEEETPYKLHGDETFIDELHEFAGRGCYLSWNRPNPATATNEGYLGHIDEVKHYSILGHGYVNFYVTGVSRSLLQELVRHQEHMNINLSVLSQRYVDMSRKSNVEVVVPPVYDDYMAAVLEQHFHECQERYERTVEYLVGKGHTRKAARGAARAFLPEATETRFLVSGHIRAWRDIISKRDSDSADAEIRNFAREVRRILKEVAPNSMIGV